MSLPLLFACLWVVAATLVAFMPMKIQMIVGLPLLAAALGLIVWLSIAHGLLLGALGLAACLSMFRKPIAYFWRKVSGRQQETS